MVHPRDASLGDAIVLGPDWPPDEAVEAEVLAVELARRGQLLDDVLELAVRLRLGHKAGIERRGAEEVVRAQDERQREEEVRVRVAGRV